MLGSSKRTNYLNCGREWRYNAQRIKSRAQGNDLTAVVQFFKGIFGNIVDSLVLALEKLVELPRNIKQAFILILDMGFVSAALWVAIAMRLGGSQFQLGPVEYACAAMTTLVSSIIFLRLGLYRAVIRFMGQQAIWAIIRGVSYSTLVLGACIFFTQAHVPRSLPFIYWGLSLLLIGGTRLLVRAYYQHKIRSFCEKENPTLMGSSLRLFLRT